MNDQTVAAPSRKPRRRRLLRKLAAALVAFTISFGLCELAARIVFPAPPDPTRTPQIVYVYSKDLGYIHLPNQEGWIDDGFVTINALGFRGPAPQAPRPDDVLRVLVIGSSNTAGWGVNDDETYCTRLENQLPRESLAGRPAEVLNWSVSGYKMEHKERLLRHYGLALKPDLLLVDFSDYDLFAPDDTPHVGQDLELAAAPTIAHTGQTFRLMPEPSWPNRLLRKSRALYVAKNGLYGLMVALGGSEGRASNEIALLEGRSSPEIDAAWQKVEVSLERVARLTEAMTGRVGVLVFPVREQVAKDYPNEQYQSRLKAAAERLGLFVVDPLPRFREHAGRLNELFIPYDRGHPGPLGHQLIADAIAEAVAARSSATSR